MMELNIDHEPHTRRSSHSPSDVELEVGADAQAQNQTVAMHSNPSYVAASFETASSSQPEPHRDNVQNDRRQRRTVQPHMNSLSARTRAPASQVYYPPFHAPLNAGLQQPGPPPPTMQLSFPPPGGTQNRSGNFTHVIDCQVIAGRLHEFAEFLANFSNTTGPAIDTRMQKIEAMFADYLHRAKTIAREHEKRVNERVETLTRNVRAACAFSEEDNHERDVGLAKSVSEAVISALGPRFDDVNRRVEEHETITRALQTSIKSFDSRLKKIENQMPRSTPSSFPTFTSIRPPVSLSSPPTPSTPSTSANSDAPAPSPSSDQFEELRFMLDVMSKLVEGAREEAHLDKEALALLLNDRHRGLSVTLHNEILPLKNAIGVGRGTKLISLVERLDALAIDLRGAIEHLKNMEALNGGSPAELKCILDMLTRHIETSSGPGKDLHDTAVMVNYNEVCAENCDISRVNDNNAEAVPEAVSSPIPSPHDEVSPSGSSGPISPADEPTPTSSSDIPLSNEPTLSTGPFTSDIDITGGNFVPVSSWSVPFPHQHQPLSPASTSSAGANLTVGTGMNTNNLNACEVPVSLTDIRMSGQITLKVRQSGNQEPVEPNDMLISSQSSSPLTSCRTTPSPTDERSSDVQDPVEPSDMFISTQLSSPLTSCRTTPSPTDERSSDVEEPVESSDILVSTQLSSPLTSCRTTPSPTDALPLDDQVPFDPTSTLISPQSSSRPSSDAASSPTAVQLPDEQEPFDLSSTPISPQSTSSPPSRDATSPPTDVLQSCIQATFDPSSTLISPPPSSSPPTRFPSPTVALKRKAHLVDNADVNSESESEDNESSSGSTRQPSFAPAPNPVSAADFGDDDYTFDFNRSMSPLTSLGDDAVIDLDMERSPSPLTPLSSDNEDGLPDGDSHDDGGGASEAESEKEPSALATNNRLPSPPKQQAPPKKRYRYRPNRPKAPPEVRGEYPCVNNCGRVFPVMSSMRSHVNLRCLFGPRPSRGSFACPYRCGKVYSLKDSLNKHLMRRCPGWYGLTQDEDQSQNQTQDQSRNQTQNHSQDQTQDHSQNQTQDHSQNQTQDQSQSQVPLEEGSRASSVRAAKRRKVMQGADDSSVSVSASASASVSRERIRKKGKGRAQKSAEKEKVVTHVHPQEVLQNADWPPKSMVSEMFDHQLLQCDRCDTSYHYRCVGVKRGDQRLVPDAPFICPPCTYINDPEATLNKHDGSCCGRPDCDWPGEAADDDEDYFVVEKILGRRMANSEGPPESIYRWLVKWSGYPLSDCDWLEESGLPEADKLIGTYYAAAAAEGICPRDDGKVYLLKEAHSKLHQALQRKWKWTVNWT